MMRICFICLGNICRSPMAEFIMKDKVNKLGLENDFHIESRATSYEEEGNDMYPPAKRILDNMNISYTRHYSKRVEKEDYSKFDLFVCMEDSNIRNLSYIFDDTDKKVIKLLDRNISDPWYTGNFISTYNDLVEGIDELIKRVK
ncbi:MAG: low molecular weight phosphotyrosine protein phosphatase [Bacilli bacterium]|nr:low molecular weight phosphotyrosine protein phosphatase [Bacilli bacterium]